MARRAKLFDTPKTALRRFAVDLDELVGKIDDPEFRDTRTGIERNLRRMVGTEPNRAWVGRLIAAAGMRASLSDLLDAVMGHAVGPLQIRQLFFRLELRAYRIYGGVQVDGPAHERVRHRAHEPGNPILKNCRDHAIYMAGYRKKIVMCR